MAVAAMPSATNTEPSPSENASATPHGRRTPLPASRSCDRDTPARKDR